VRLLVVLQLFLEPFAIWLFTSTFLVTLGAKLDEVPDLHKKPDTGARGPTGRLRPTRRADFLNIRRQKLQGRGVYASVAEIAEAEKINRSYVSRILRLTLLTPNIVEAIPGGWADHTERTDGYEQPYCLR
jgi:hypothetical protein